MKFTRTNIARILAVIGVSILATVSVGLIVHAPLACIPVVTSRGAFSTAAVNNVPNTGGVIDGSGCDIGDYVNASITVSGLVVHDSNQYGIFVDSGIGSITVDISSVTVYNIGAHTGPVFTPNGVQTGIGIIYDSGPNGPTAYGSITNSYVHDYQKGGIEAYRNSNVTTTNNNVNGLGRVSYIAQNGIEYARDPEFTSFLGKTQSWQADEQYVWLGTTLFQV